MNDVSVNTRVLPDSYSLEYENQLIDFLNLVVIFESHDFMLRTLFEINPLNRIKHKVKKIEDKLTRINETLRLVAREEMLTVFLLDIRDFFERDSERFNQTQIFLATAMDVERLPSSVPRGFPQPRSSRKFIFPK